MYIYWWQVHTSPHVPQNASSRTTTSRPTTSLLLALIKPWPAHTASAKGLPGLVCLRPRDWQLEQGQDNKVQRLLPLLDVQLCWLTQCVADRKSRFHLKRFHSCSRSTECPCPLCLQNQQQSLWADALRRYWFFFDFSNWCFYCYIGAYLKLFFLLSLPTVRQSLHQQPNLFDWCTVHACSWSASALVHSLLLWNPRSERPLVVRKHYLTLRYTASSLLSSSLMAQEQKAHMMTRQFVMQQATWTACTLS